MRQALVIIDMLNDFVLPGAPLEVPENRTILPHLQQRLARARTEQTPVIFVSDAHAAADREFTRMGWPPHAVAGPPGAQASDELRPQPGEHLVAKTISSGCYQTELAPWLEKLQVEELVLTGRVTNIRIPYTAADVVMRGYRFSVPRDRAADFDPMAGRYALEQMEQILGVQVV